MKRMTGPDIFLSFLKIGIVGFGGGSALIPVVERELLGNRAVLGEKDYRMHTIIANITPGALPVKLGASCGWQLGGPGGSAAGAWAVALPGVLLTIAVMMLFQVMGGGVVEYLNAASVGVSAFIIFLLYGYMKKSMKKGGRRTNFFICAAAFMLTGGHEIQSLRSILTGLESMPPLFNISTISLMILAFFIIIAVEFSPSRRLFPLFFLLGGGYAFFSGNYSGAMGWDLPRRVILVLMALSCPVLFLLRKKTAPAEAAGAAGVSGINESNGDNESNEDNEGGGVSGTADPSTKKQTAILLAIMILPALVCTILAALFNPARDVLLFISRVCFSTISSFGGGEAYVSVADGLFVQTGLIPPDLFYTRLVPAANALPGPILIKIAAGAAFVFGLSRASFLGACLTAAAAAAASLGICGILAVLATVFYDRLRDSRLTARLVRYIPPIICGMLLSTSCSMIGESMRIMQAARIHPWLSMGALIGWVVLLCILTRFKRFPDPALLLVSACVSAALIGA